MTHVEFWCKRCYIPKGHFTHQESITDAPMLRVCGKPPAPGRGRRRSGKPGSPWERADTPDTRTAETPPACSQRLTRGVAPHAQTPKSRRSDSQDCFKRTRAFSDTDSCSARATRESICRAQTLGGPALSPSARAGVSTLSLEVRWAVAKDISVTAMFRIHLVEKPWEKRNCTCCCDAGSETHLGQGSCAVCLHGTCGRASCRDGKFT